MQEQRNKYIIEKEFQYAFIKSTLLIVGASLAMFVCSQVIFFKKMINYGQTAGLEKDHVYFQFISDQQTQMTIIGFICFALLSAFTIYWALKFSNRIAGPLFRLKKDLQRKAMGEDVKFKFRDGDFFPELPTLIDDIFAKHAKCPDSLSDNGNDSDTSHKKTVA